MKECDFGDIIQLEGLVISRDRNPFSDEYEWCIGTISTGGTVSPISYGKTIKCAVNAYVAIKTKDA